MSPHTPAYSASSPDIDSTSDDLDHIPDIAESRRSGINPELWARIWFVLAMVALAYFVQLSEIGRSAAAGSQSAYLVVAPVLAGLVAAGYSRAPRGVIDAESDWIGALLLGGAGFAALWLIEDRLPTMAALWHVDNLALLVWVAAVGTIVFSTRHILRMWNVWLLGALLAPVMPFMLLTAQLGGSDTAIALVAAGVGSAAVFLAGRFVQMRPRLLATVINIAVSTVAVALLADVGLYLRILIAAGLVPLVVVLALHRIDFVSRSRHVLPAGSALPKTKPWSYVAVLAAAVALLVVHLPIERPGAVEEVRSDWIAASGLAPVEDFPFITSFLGPDASLTRYRAPGGAGEYQTVVDVMSSPNLARLQDFEDAVWYPAATPVNYTAYRSTEDGPADIKTAHSDADSATDEESAHWNAVTWQWRSGAVFQRVTVITSQTRSIPPPAPRALTFENSLIEPALWVTRQQPSQSGVVDRIVEASTEVVVNRLLSAGELHTAGVMTP